MYLQNKNKLSDIEKRLVVAKGQGGQRREGMGIWYYQSQAIIYRMTKQQSPTVQHRGLYSTSRDKPQWKKYEKEYIYITESLCCTEEINTTL